MASAHHAVSLSGESDEEDEEEHKKTMKRQRLLLAATLTVMADLPEGNLRPRLHPSLPPREEAKSVRSARGVSGGTLHQDEMGGGRGEDGATYRCRVNGVAGERREEGARKRPTRRHCAVRIPKKMLWTRKIQTVVPFICGENLKSRKKLHAAFDFFER